MNAFLLYFKVLVQYGERKSNILLILYIMHLSLAFPGVNPQDTHGEPLGTRGEWYIFDNFLGAQGGDIVWFWK